MPCIGLEAGKFTLLVGCATNRAILARCTLRPVHAMRFVLSQNQRDNSRINESRRSCVQLIACIMWTGPYTKLIIEWQLSKCLKFMTFQEGCFVIRNWMQVLKWSSWDFLSPLILQRWKKIISVCEQQYTHGYCYISLFKFKSFDQFNTPQTSSNFRHLLSCGTIVLMNFLKF